MLRLGGRLKTWKVEGLGLGGRACLAVGYKLEKVWKVLGLGGGVVAAI